MFLIDRIWVIFIRIPIIWKSEVSHTFELSPKMRKVPNSSKDSPFSPFLLSLILASPQRLGGPGPIWLIMSFWALSPQGPTKVNNHFCLPAPQFLVPVQWDSYLYVLFPESSIACIRGPMLVLRTVLEFSLLTRQERGFGIISLCSCPSRDAEQPVSAQGETGWKTGWRSIFFPLSLR